jgi:hypothetical protein
MQHNAGDIWSVLSTQRQGSDADILQRYSVIFFLMDPFDSAAQCVFSHRKYGSDAVLILKLNKPTFHLPLF